MQIGVSVTWRESVVTKKNDRWVKTGDRTVTGTIVEHGHNPRTGGKTVKIAVTAVTGSGTSLIGTEVWRKRAKVSKGRSWLKASAKSSKPTKPKRR